MDHETHDMRPPSFWRSRFGIGWLVLAAVAAWFLFEEHRAHLLGALPYLIALACPLMHVFMHRGHHGHHGDQGHHGGAGATGGDRDGPTPPEQP